MSRYDESYDLDGYTLAELDDLALALAELADHGTSEAQRMHRRAVGTALDEDDDEMLDDAPEEDQEDVDAEEEARALAAHYGVTLGEHAPQTADQALAERARAIAAQYGVALSEAAPDEVARFYGWASRELGYSGRVHAEIAASRASHLA